MSAGAIGEYAWHVHHEILFEKLTEPMQKRIDYIKTGGKSSNEIPLRLKLMRVVGDQKKLADLVVAMERGWKTWEKAMGDTNSAYRKDRTGKTAGSAEEAAEKAFADLAKQNQAIYALHEQECEPDCPWNGATIFGKGAKV